MHFLHNLQLHNYINIIYRPGSVNEINLFLYIFFSIQKYKYLFAQHYLKFKLIIWQKVFYNFFTYL